MADFDVILLHNLLISHSVEAQSVGPNLWRRKV